nr:MAG TPA: hypothetical protein [Caudoviricetes sp.]
MVTGPARGLFHAGRKWSSRIGGEGWANTHGLPHPC